MGTVPNTTVVRLSEIGAALGSYDLNAYRNTTWYNGVAQQTISNSPSMSEFRNLSTLPNYVSQLIDIFAGDTVYFTYFRYRTTTGELWINATTSGGSIYWNTPQMYITMSAYSSRSATVSVDGGTGTMIASVYGYYESGNVIEIKAQPSGGSPASANFYIRVTVTA